MNGTNKDTSTATTTNNAASTNTPTSSLTIGLEHQSPIDTHEALAAAREDGFGFVSTTIQTTAIRRDVSVLESKWWRTSVVGIIPNKSDNNKSSSMEQQWTSHLLWAWHMDLPAVSVPALPSAVADVPAYAAALATCSQWALQEAGAAFQLWVPIDSCDNKETLAIWQAVSRMAGSPSNVGIVLNILNSQLQLSEDTTAQSIMTLHNWIACGPIYAVRVSTSQFLLNKRGYPTLSKGHQKLVEFTLQRVGRTIQWVLYQSDEAKNKLAHLALTATGRSGCLPYWQYLQHIRTRAIVTAVLDSPEGALEQEYLDTLQKPLQPLANHLMFSTYETFEKDPVKYERYQLAIQKALTSLSSSVSKPQYTIFVVGAGRGPLVSCALQASKLPVRCVCIEKNPSAVSYLRSRAELDPVWKNRVIVVNADLRYLTKEQCSNATADIVVSELLGSFGCNELSPECMDDFFRGPCCLQRTICIPREYKSFLAPISSIHLHNQVQARSLFPNATHTGVEGWVTASETPYVVRTHAASQLYREEECWHFSHTPRSRLKENTSNDRSCSLAFGPEVELAGNGYGQPVLSVLGTAESASPKSPPCTKSQPWVLTGLLGTFSANLFDDVYISTVPSKFSVGMFSWFPLYFPFKDPVLVPPGALVQVLMWRKSDDARVWYEWSATVWDGDRVVASTPIHNVRGRSYHVGLTL